MAMRERAVQANMIFKAWELIPLAQKTVTTDFGPLELAKLAKLASEIDRGRVVTLVIDAQYANPFTTYDGAQVLLPNKPANGRSSPAVRPEPGSHLSIKSTRPTSTTCASRGNGRRSAMPGPISAAR